MRARTGRFDGLMSAGKFGDSQPFEEDVRQRHVERHRRVVPPALAVGGNPSGQVGGHSASDELAIACGATRRRIVRAATDRNEKPGNFDVVARVTLLLVSLTRSFSLPPRSLPELFQHCRQIILGASPTRDTGNDRSESPNVLARYQRAGLSCNHSVDAFRRSRT